MNGKKAKAIRHLSRLTTTGAPDVAYDTKPSGQRVLRRDCTRALTKALKGLGG